MNEALVLRRQTDLVKLRELQTKLPNFLEIIKVGGNPLKSINLRINIPTAKNSKYPLERQDKSEVEVALPENYPLPPGPHVFFSTPIFNPNVYPSMKWCFGDWTITENLQLFVLRLMKVIALDPSIINPGSAANIDAARWYVELKKRQPNLFPTVSIAELIIQAEKPKVSWRSIK